MLTTVEIVEAIVITTIMVRQRITDKAIITDVAIETITIIIKKIMVFTGVSNVTYLVIAIDHIDTDRIGIDAMIAGKKISIVII